MQPNIDNVQLVYSLLNRNELSHYQTNLAHADKCILDSLHII